MPPIERLRRWMDERALPLWSGAGYDPARRLFHERLDLDGRPVSMPALRLMVQARQVATLARVALSAHPDAPALGVQALDCLWELVRRYEATDGAPGWVYALAPDGSPADTRRDLYAHAFILFALGWAYRLCGDQALLSVASRTAAAVEAIFRASHGGYLDAVPPLDTVRRQNPHMHLLEAWLLLFEATGDQHWADRAAEMVALGLERFIAPRFGTLPECFDASWQPLDPPGRNRIEPGHLFEWSWLLREHDRLTAPGAHVRATAGRLLSVGLELGLDRARWTVCDAVLEAGGVLEASSRIWPQTELMRALAGSGHPGATVITDRLIERFLSLHAPAALGGGWIDRFCADDRPAIDHMPASSLYHIHGALAEL